MINELKEELKQDIQKQLNVRRWWYSGEHSCLPKTTQ
jgi:hypothetical protein